MVFSRVSSGQAAFVSLEEIRRRQTGETLEGNVGAVGEGEVLGAGNGNAGGQRGGGGAGGEAGHHAGDATADAVQPGPKWARCATPPGLPGRRNIRGGRRG